MAPLLPLRKASPNTLELAGMLLATPPERLLRRWHTEEPLGATADAESRALPGAGASSICSPRSESELIAMASSPRHGRPNSCPGRRELLPLRPS